MKKKNLTLLFVLSAMIAIIVLATQCKNHGSAATVYTDTVITPVPLPVLVPGFSFPQDSATVYSWLQPTYDSTKVYNHAWGIWAGLTAQSGETYQGDSILVYQTWLGINDIQNQLQATSANLSKANAVSHRTLLSFPNQTKDAIRMGKLSKVTAVDDTTPVVWTAVSYNPTAANFTMSNSLLKQSTLNKYVVNGGIGSIPQFPDTAMTIKPVYYVGHKTDLLIRVPVWPGPPAKAKAFGPKKWNTYVYADVKNLQKPGRQLVPVTGDNPTPQQILDATCNLNDFVNFKLDTAMAAYMNQQQAVGAQTGDVALLVAMHVTTKEIHNWTWQSFYWDPNPSTPFSPSSSLAAKLKPAQLKTPANHYSLTTAYVEVLPNQPINNGKNTGVSPMIGYNPYLEAHFGPGTFAFKNSMDSTYKFGIQTNCMSCHALAATNTPNAPYSTDQYISMNNPIFNNSVQVDFAWSIANNVIPTTQTKGKK